MNPENESVPASKATTLAGSAAPSRAGSLKKEAHSATFHPQDELDGVPSKDRAPPFVVALCLFQSLAGLLFGWVDEQLRWWRFSRTPKRS